MLPAALKRQIANNNIKFYTIDATKIGEEIGLGSRINMIMQAAFFKLADVIPLDKATEYLKAEIVKAYGKKGEAIVNMNYAAVDRGITAFHQVAVPEAWKTATDAKGEESKRPAFIRDVVDVINGQKGDDLPVSTFKDIEDGISRWATSAYEKRGIAVNVPEWQVDNCIQCNRCSLVCPHAAIRPFLLDAAEAAGAPEGMKTLNAMGPQFKGLQYKIQVSTLDCAGCGNCADVCPAKEKALIMKPQACRRS
jgi:pyruvate-ferredoxin/flavodoxin oxidoreductase